MAGNHKGGGIKSLALAHVEKVVIAVVALAAAYLVWASMGVEGMEDSPGDLTQLVSNTEEAYKRASWASAPEENKKEFRPIDSGNLADLPAGAYASADKRGLSRPAVPPVIDRTDPKLLPPQDLEATALTGIFAFVDEETLRERERERQREEQRRAKELEQQRKEGGELFGGGRGGPGGEMPGQELVDEQGRKRRPAPGMTRPAGVPTQGDELFKAMSVACVVAKAPSKEQFAIFQQTLEEAKGYDPGADYPDYIALQAERAEVTGDDDAELKWETVRFGDAVRGEGRAVLDASATLQRAFQKWIPWPEQLVDSRYGHRVLTMPLPPLVGQAWKPAEVVHSDAPLQAETDLAERKAQRNPQQEATEETPEGEIVVGDAAGGRGGRFGGGGYGGGEFGGGEYGGYGGPGGGYGGGEFGGGEYGGGGGAMAFGEGYDPDIPFKMIRIFDFNVQPGRQYVYRVRLVLRDPNHNVPDSALAREVIDRRKDLSTSQREYRKTEWSEPTSVVSVPMAGDVFVIGAKPASARSGEGTVDLLVQTYKLDESRRAIKAATEESFFLGSVMNLTADAEVLSSDGRWIVQHDDFQFRTDLTLCDFRGGKELPGDHTEPVSVLLMDASGKLITHNSLDDAEAIQRHRDAYSETNQGNFGGGYGGGGYGGEYGGGEYGGGEFGGGEFGGRR
ncbi:hypothetical protein [Botrimarina sp.]|uniref:hypothetical protein n=1 Tax=Botrimarina sp. TaxID=2795802 RepID=UPI0032EAC212